ncbi:L-idonate 5-dehydrogenase [Psychromicrobium lacuslunae]|uniref:Zinc-binding alcohol dehydrogenase n=1 Tax=Psychromicrobium lacuslunae TaxID=1618207 RepID=A0A0D4C0U4_9MICC|nr:L-idonate 5-dehydrogenase [Psychromicrobium lacuslunae]AJT42005.1 zinc-binding alcohol dehydrogenase [Psychromicrobium lacuslunae]
MKTNIGVVIHAKGDLRLEELPMPEPTADQALIEIAFGGICGSDLHYWRHGAAGQSILREPMLLGHEVVGTVLQAASDGSSPAAGTQVAVHPATELDDEARTPYPADKPNLAPGGTYLGSAARFPHTQGGFARYLALPGRMLRALPEGLSLRDAAIAEPAAVAWHAVKQAGYQTGEQTGQQIGQQEASSNVLSGAKVLVIGAGPIGSLIVAAAKSMGAREIVAVDLQAKPLEIAATVGASSTLQAPNEDDLDAMHADVVFESSGHHSGLGLALRGAKRGGRVVMVGLLPAGPQPVEISLVVSRELQLTGSFRFNEELDEVLFGLADGRLNAAHVVTHSFPVQQALEAFDVAGDPSRSGKVLLEF